MNNQEQVGRGLILLGQGLYPYIRQAMQAAFPSDWESVAKFCLPNYKSIRNKSVDTILSEDVSMLLLVMSKQWDKLCGKKLTNTEHGIVLELIEIRNNWAHHSPFSTADTHRTLDSIARLLRAVSTSETDIDLQQYIQQVEKYQQEVQQQLFQEQINRENRRSSAEAVDLEQRLDTLLKQLPFQDVFLLHQALTHRSYLFENPKEVSQDNELLEFLGDALLNFISGEYLYDYYRDNREKTEGDLTKLRSALVDNKQLAEFASSLGLGQWIFLGKGASETGRQNPSLLSNTFEAIVGAYFLDSGIEAVRNFLKPLFDSIRERAIHEVAFQKNSIDPKSRLQQLVLKEFGQTPEYVVNESGADNAKEFTAEVYIKGTKYSEAKARRKKDAEKACAEAALYKLKQQGYF